MPCPQCGDPYAAVEPGKVCGVCIHDDCQRGERATGHSRHDDPGPMGDYGEADNG